MPKLDVICYEIWNALKVDIDNGLTREALQSTKHRLKLFVLQICGPLST